MISPISRFFIHAFVGLGIWLPAQAAAVVEIASPNGKLTFSVTIDAGGHLAYTIKRDDRPVVESSPLGILVDGQDFGADAALGHANLGNTDARYPMFGGHDQAIDRSRDATILVTSGANQAHWTLDVRVFDDGAAWRYRVPGSGERKIGGESTAWNLPPGGTIWYQDEVNPAYEAIFRTTPVAALKIGHGVMNTALIRLTGDPIYVMMTEGNLVNSSDMTLASTAPNTFSARFPNSPVGWTQTGEIVSPWRITIVASDLNTLVNTDIIRNVCPPPAVEVAGADWIQPGRATWSWMISRAPKLDQQKQWIDWTNQLSFENYLIDDGWNRWKQDGKDAWACMKDVAAYAKSRNVRIWAWTDSKELLTREARTTYFKKSRAAGIVGLKIDFIKPADPWWVQWYDDTIREMADAKLLVNFHGCVKPSGRERTWPNNLTREAVNGRESRKRPGLHDTTLPFTRYIQGPADYTPTDFRVEELRGNSYAHELAQAIVYTSPLLVYSGSPSDYLASEACELIKAIPPVWDETVVLPGSAVGEVAAYARRRGKDWFLGVVNGSQPSELSISLKFLDLGPYTFEQFADDPVKNNGWIAMRKRVTATDNIIVNLRADGGYVSRLIPIDPGY